MSCHSRDARPDKVGGGISTAFMVVSVQIVVDGKIGGRVSLRSWCVGNH
jgi:hypothetical protein